MSNSILVELGIGTKIAKTEATKLKWNCENTSKVYKLCQLENML